MFKAEILFFMASLLVVNSETIAPYPPATLESTSSATGNSNTPYPPQNAPYQPSAPVVPQETTDGSQYTSYVPHDAIQQYVTNYGGAALPVGYGPVGYGPEPGFSVQTGYEGYLVPTGGYVPAPVPPPAGGFVRFLSSLLPLPKLAMNLLGRASMYLLGGAGFLLMGGALTTAVCTLTPLCTITILGLGFSRDSVRESVRGLITPDRISAASQFVTEAIAKYQKLQKNESKISESN